MDFTKLAYHEMCGGNIKNVVFRAAAAAALRDKGKCIIMSGLSFCSIVTNVFSSPVGSRQVTMEDLEESCEEEMAKSAKRFGFRRQDSESARIYN